MREMLGRDRGARTGERYAFGECTSGASISGRAGDLSPAGGHGVTVATYEPHFARPDLPVPPSPLPRFARFARRHFRGPNGLSFADSYRATAAWAVAGLFLAVAALQLYKPWQWEILACSAVIGLFATVRALALLVIERRQHAFEGEWVVAQSGVLQGHAFEILRFTVADLTSTGSAARRVYDLTRPADVRHLLSLWRREQEQRSQPSRATVEFSYLAGEGVFAVGVVHRELPELVFREGWAGPDRAAVRFPGARYILRPERGMHPAQRTYWVLSGLVVITVSEPA